jgi:hypothetical protein
MGHCLTTLYNKKSSTGQGDKKEKLIDELEAIFDFNNDGKVDWKDVWDFFKAIGGPEELNILKQKLIPIIEAITLPLSSGLTLVIKLVIETLVNGIDFTKLESTQQRQEALNKITEDEIKTLLSHIIDNYNNKIPSLVQDYVLNNPSIKAEIEKQLISDPAFQKSVMEALQTPSTPRIKSKAAVA